jgi:hypothetical protein
VKARVEVAVVIILALIGTVIAAYSCTQLQKEDVLFNYNSIQLGGQSYKTWQVGLIPGNYFYVFTPRIVGSVGSVGTGVDFYLVNFTNYHLWTNETGLRSALSVVHLNSSLLSSQSGGQFSTNMGEWAWIVILVNDEYPNVNSASVHANIIFEYISLFNFCAFIAGLAMLGIAIAQTAVLILKDKIRKSM